MALLDAHALVIGIAAYQRIPSLAQVQDARDVASVLADPACCGYPPGAVQTLIDGAATRAAILDALDALATTTTEASTVFLYYSGHGAHAVGPGGSDEYYLVPTDASNASRDALSETAISNAVLTAKLRAIPAGRLTLVLDCCRASDLAVPNLGPAIAAFGQGRGRVVLAASRAAGEAYQLPGQRDSVLTGFLVAGLRGAAPGAGGVLRVVDLFQYVQERVAALPLDQHPVLKAELEENYAIAELHTPPVTLPPPPDGAGYDAFVSYCEADPDDRAWVTRTLIPALEAAGLKLCLEDRDFELGAARVDELDRAVAQSRYVVGVFSPAYLASPESHYEAMIAAQAESESPYPRFMPLLRKPCSLSLHQRMTAALDVSRDGEVPATLQRLALALRQAPKPRLT